jgi:hypothetical protein
MQIAILSDSHYAVDQVRRLLTYLELHGINHLIHAGDFIGLNIEKVLADFPGITMWIARGNCDTDGKVLDSINRLNHVTVNDQLRFEIEGIAFLVAHIPGMALNELNKSHADVVIHGHTHLPRTETYNGALLLNPGSLMDGDGFMILDLPALTVNRHFTFY